MFSPYKLKYQSIYKLSDYKQFTKNNLITIIISLFMMVVLFLLFYLVVNMIDEYQTMTYSPIKFIKNFGEFATYFMIPFSMMCLFISHIIILCVIFHQIRLLSNNIKFTKLLDNSPKFVQFIKQNIEKLPQINIKKAIYHQQLEKIVENSNNQRLNEIINQLNIFNDVKKINFQNQEYTIPFTKYREIYNEINEINNMFSKNSQLELHKYSLDYVSLKELRSYKKSLIQYIKTNII